MHQEDHIDAQRARKLLGKDGLLARARNRTEQEHSSSLSAPPYAAAALGHAPYVAMGNGVIVVQSKCNWNC